MDYLILIFLQFIYENCKKIKLFQIKKINIFHLNELFNLKYRSK